MIAKVSNPTGFKLVLKDKKLQENPKVKRWLKQCEKTIKNHIKENYE